MTAITTVSDPAGSLSIAGRRWASVVSILTMNSSGDASVSITSEIPHSRSRRFASEPSSGAKTPITSEPPRFRTMTSLGVRKEQTSSIRRTSNAPA